MAMPMTRGVGRAEVLFVSLVAALLLHGGHARPDSDAEDYDPTSCELTTPEATCPSNMFCFESGRAGGINRFAEIIEEPLAGCGLGVYDCVNGTEFDQLCTCFQFMNMVPIREGAFPGDEDYGCEPGGMAGVMMIFAVFHALVDLMVSVSYAWTTVYQLVVTKSLTMKQIITINPATTTLIFCSISSTGILLRQFVYIIALTGNDPDGTLYDATGGVLLACIVVGAAGGVIEVLIMWLDVLKKAKSMKSNSNTIKRLKLGCSVSLVVLLVASVGCMAVGRQDILAYIAMGYFLPIAIVCHIGGKKLRKMLANKDGSDTAASTAINGVATRLVKLIGTLYLFVIIYIIYFKKVANGYIGYFGISCAFFVACWVNNLLISYVRFGARKKLTEAGYLLITSKVHPNGTITTGMAMTMQPTTSTSTSDATPRDGGVGGKEIPPLSPILAKLNSFWRMGYQAL